MKSDHLKESNNIEDRRGQNYSQSSSNSNLGGGFYRSYYRLEASRVRSSLSSSQSFQEEELVLGDSLEMGLLLNLTSPPKLRAPIRPMSTMQMPSSSARSLPQQKIIGTRYFKPKDGPTRSPNQSSILDGHRQAVGQVKHRLALSTVQPTRKFIWI